MAIWMVLEDFSGDFGAPVAGFPSVTIAGAGTLLDDTKFNVPALIANGCPLIPFTGTEMAAAKTAFDKMSGGVAQINPDGNLLALLVATGAIADVAAIASFVPVYVCSGAGAVGQLGDVMAHRIGKVVTIFGQLNFTPGVAGVAETITFTLPSTMQPTNNFSNNGEGGGASLLNVHAATDFCSPITGVAGTKTLRFTVLTNLTPSPLYWRATYKINN